MPLASGFTPEAIMVPATWVEWSLTLLALSFWVTRPVSSTWVGSGLASSQMAIFPLTEVDEPLRLSPVLPPGQSRLVRMVAAEIILSSVVMYMGIPWSLTSLNMAMRPFSPFRVVGHPFWRARVCSWLYRATSFWAVVWLALSRTSVLVFTCALAWVAASRDNKVQNSKSFVFMFSTWAIEIIYFSAYLMKYDLTRDAVASISFCIFATGMNSEVLT